METGAKGLAILGVWGVVGVLIYYSDPAMLKDVGVRGTYLPLLIPLFVAITYSYSLIVTTMRMMWLLALGTTLLIAVLLIF